MPKATLEFKLPDENEEFQSAVNGALMRSFVFDLWNHYRSIFKHSPDPAESEVAGRVLDDMREMASAIGVELP